MTEEERTQILRMVAQGVISPEDGLNLMRVLDETPHSKTPDWKSKTTERSQSIPSGSFETTSAAIDPHLEEIRSKARRLWQIPLWIGVAVVLASAWGMFLLLQNAGLNFWFFCLIAPLLLGALLIAAAVASHRMRWIYLDIRQKAGEKPERLWFGFPLPLKLTAWFLRTFGNRIDSLRLTHIDEVIQVLETSFSDKQPLIISVEDDEDGERVQIYIG